MPVPLAACMKRRNLLTKLTLLFAVLLTFGAAQAQADILNPVIVKVIQVKGAEGTGSCGAGYDLGVGLVDLDHGLAAGATTYDHETATITGGTGRFTNATGNFTLGGQIDFTTVPPSFVLPWHGTISRPGGRS